MSAAPVNVVLNLDFGPFVKAMEKVAASAARFARTWAKAGYSAGDHHVDRIVQDCSRRRLSVEETALRLLVAADVAEVLDRRPGGAR